MRGPAALALAALGVAALASCSLDFDSFDFIQFAAGGAGGTGGGGVGGSCEPFCDQGGGGTGGSPSGMGGDAGMGGTGGVGTGGDGTGGGMDCNNPNQCPPGMDTDCANRTCDMGMCGLELAPAATPCSDDGGDVCDGMGNCVACGSPPTAPGGNMCPAECTGGCEGANNELCVIECDDSNECATQMLTCPADFDCQVNCTGSNGCAMATINCPSTYQCTINCNGSNACVGTDFNCSMDGPCNLSCGNQQCAGGTLTCGSDACGASCQGGVGKPTVTCNDSCNCTPC